MKDPVNRDKKWPYRDPLGHIVKYQKKQKEQFHEQTRQNNWKFVKLAIVDCTASFEMYVNLQTTLAFAARYADPSSQTGWPWTMMFPS